MTPETIALKLTDARRTHEDLTDNWAAFCDCDPLPHPRDDYPDCLERLGYAELVAVDAHALDDPFAVERGIEPDGMMWTLTPLGIQV